jgi:hypothetical protein
MGLHPAGRPLSQKKSTGVLCHDAPSFRSAFSPSLSFA